MKRLITFVIGAVVIAIFVHVGVLHALPNVIMSKVMTKIGGDGGMNAFAHMPLPTDKARAVVRPSPDLAYSICTIDLTNGPVHIEVPLTKPYTSVALYATNTDNYFVRNDRDTGGKSLDVVVIGQGTPKPESLPEGAELVTAPTTKSLVLVRRVVESAAAFGEIDTTRKSSVCAPL
ncbi:MAG: DUF1254 domain-containing protein [Parvibaculum sp.]|nr:DUF1254 domain-containing protein [Parvibaculum sp.]